MTKELDVATGEVELLSLNGRSFRVVSASAGSVVSSATILTLTETGPYVCGRYSGGSVVEGFLIGVRSGSKLQFRYLQGDRAGTIDYGVSEAEIEAGQSGKLRIIERYRWLSRDGSGTNVFDEVTI
jgi:hypothetical protein